MAKRKSNYGDNEILSKPIITPLISLLYSKKDVEAFIKEARIERLEALFKHHSLDINSHSDCIFLTMKLAKELEIPGFKVVYPEREPPKSVGTPQKWKNAGGIKLYIDVYLLLKKEMSQSAALRHLHQNSKYSDYTLGTLQRRYHEIKKRWGADHCKNINILIENLPENIRENLLTSFGPNGHMIFNDSELAKVFVALYQKEK